jgi:F-type H+-transporting ATPase subunit epsilon
MNEKKLRLLVTMPAKVVVDELVDMVILTTKEGHMGILPGHEPATVALDNGALYAGRGGGSGSGGSGGSGRSDGGAALTVLGGYATIRDDVVRVMTPIADTPEHINQALLAISREQEQNKQYERTANLEVSRAEMALRNILLRREGSVLPFLVNLGDEDDSNG